MKKVEKGHRHEFIAKGNMWPEWGSFIVGVAGGYEVFENDEDGTKWLEKFEKSQSLKRSSEKKAEKKEEEKYFERELPYTGPIGFRAA